MIIIFVCLFILFCEIVSLFNSSGYPRTHSIDHVGPGLRDPDNNF